MSLSTDQRLDTISQTLTKIATTQDHQGGQIEKLVHAIDGNGSPGLKMEVDRLKGQARTTKYWTRLVVGGLVTAVIGLGATAVPSCKSQQQKQQSSSSLQR